MKIREQACDSNIVISKFKFNCDEIDKSIPNPLPQNLNHFMMIVGLDFRLWTLDFATIANSAPWCYTTGICCTNTLTALPESFGGLALLTKLYMSSIFSACACDLWSTCVTPMDRDLLESAWPLSSSGLFTTRRRLALVLSRRSLVFSSGSIRSSVYAYDLSQSSYLLPSLSL